jgi:hypothetical protein
VLLVAALQWRDIRVDQAPGAPGVEEFLEVGEADVVAGRGP